MKQDQLPRRLICLLLAAALFAGGMAQAEEAYVEGEWNYVEGSMDVSGGIPENAQGVLEKIRDQGRLRVATEPYFPPQEFIDPALSGQAQFVGADMELARLIAARMGVELEIVPMEFTQVLLSVADGECDLAISGLSFTPGRAAAAEMSKGYHFSEDNAGSGLLIRRTDGDSIRGLDDLRERVVTAQSGSLQEALMAENVNAYLEFRRMGSMQEVYQLLRDGRADAAMVDIETASAYIRSEPECGLMLLPGLRFQLEKQFEGDRIAGKKGELQLMYFVNGVIDEVLSSGQYEQWLREYEAYAAKLGS